MLQNITPLKREEERRDLGVKFRAGQGYIFQGYISYKIGTMAGGGGMVLGEKIRMGENEKGENG